MKERLTEFLKYLGIGQTKFAEKVGLSRGYVNNIGDNVTMKSVNKILQAYPELNETWLLTGEGEMLNEGYSGNPQSEAGRRDGGHQTLSSLEHSFNKFIAIEEANAETNKMNAETNKTNAESFNKVADSHVSLTQSHNTLVQSHDKLIDIIKDIVTQK